MEEKAESGLTAAEESYFSSGGEASLAPEPAVEEKAEEAVLQAPPEEPVKPEQPRDERGKFVPHQALHQEREEHKQSKAELNELREKIATWEERFRIVSQAAQQPEKPVENIPDPDQDIFAAYRYSQAKLQALEDKINGAEQQAREQNEAQQQETALWNYWNKDASEFAQQTPEFSEAAKWMSETRARQLRALGKSLPKIYPQLQSDQGINAQIDAELKQMVIAAHQSGTGPASLLYNVAQEWGWQAKAKEQAPAPQQAPLTLPDKLRSVQSAQEASRTVGAASGSAGGDMETLAGIMAMPRKEFEDWAKDPKNARRFEKLMGG